MTPSRINVDLQPQESVSEDDNYRFTYDAKTTTASIAVVSAVMDVVNAAPADLTQLYHSVDTDALDELFCESRNGTVQVSFSFEGFEVTVDCIDDPESNTSSP
jgi:hypothetical protein